MFTKISPPTVNDVNVYLSTQKGGGRGEVGGEEGGRGSLTERKHFAHTFLVWKISFNFG